MKNPWTLVLLALWTKYGTCTLGSQWKCFSMTNIEIHCSANESDKKLVIHIIEAPTQKKLLIDCHNMTTFHTNLLPNVTFNSFNHLEIRYCPLPPYSFQKIADHFSMKGPEILQLERSEDITLSKKIFEGSEQLEALKLNHLIFKNLETDVFDHLPNLTYFEIEDAKNVTLKSSFFEKMRRLKVLYLGGNQITEMPAGVFQSLSRLKRLHLWGNNLTTIDDFSFKGLSNLSSLELSNNKIENISDGAFETLSNLSTVSLFSNRLTNISGNIFKNNRNLKSIWIAYNFNLTLSDYCFGNLPLLEDIDLRGCNLKELPGHVFENSTKLTVINLDKNNLSRLSPTLFAGLENLKKLYLANNLISRVDGETFQDLIALEEIYLQRNQISRIDPGAFYNKINLRTINLSRNNYTGEENVFQEGSRVENLDLSYNLVTELDNIMTRSLRKLKRINLSHNFIQKLHLVTFGEVTVILDNNNITGVKFQDIHRFDDSEITISLAGNPLSCDCNIYELLQHMREQTGGLNIIGKNLKCGEHTELKQLVLSELTCPEYDACPEKCFCNWKPFDRSRTINCSNAELTEFPEIPPNFPKLYNQTVLHLEENNLTVGPTGNLDGYNNVTKLYLSRNYIKAVPWLPPKLEVLALDNNRLTSLDFEVLTILNRSNLVNLLMGNNPWNCDCNTANFSQFLRQHSKVVRVEDISCSNNKSRLLVHLSDHDVCSQWQPILIAAVLASLLTIASLFVLVYRYQYHLKVWLFAHKMCLCWLNEEELDKEKLYDAFISYSHKDEDFVIQNLLPVLEGGPRPYKLCLHYRNWIPGEFITTQVTNSVVESRRTLVVLSPNFLESVWGKMEFRTAHTQAMTEGRARVIIVLYGDVDTNKLDEELKAYMKTNTYVKWGDPYFWNKLKYALPHSKQTVNKQKIANVLRCIDDKFQLVIPTTPSPGSTPPIVTLDPSALKKHPLSFVSNTEKETPSLEVTLL